MFVRTARETDVSDIAHICTNRWRTVAGGAVSRSDGGTALDGGFEARLERDVQGTDGHGWVVAVDDDEVVAAAGGELVDDASGEVITLHTHPDVRMTDAGSAVLQTITARQVVAGAREQYASCLPDDEDALSFYRAQGFEVVSSEGDSDGDETMVRLVRRI